MQDDQGIERRFLLGEPESCAVVVRWVAQVLTGPRFRVLRRSGNDLLQDVLRRVVESLRHGRYDASRDFRVYVQSIARYAGREALVEESRRRQWPAVDPDAFSVESTVEAVVLARQSIGKVLEQIDPECRNLFRMLFYEELSHSEIVSRLGIPIGTVKSRTFRCLKKARELFADGTLSRARTTEKENV